VAVQLSYEAYLDKIWGGWIGKSMGGAIGMRFEGIKDWIEISPGNLLPEKMPPNDDLDLQVLWLKVLEEKGLALTSVSTPATGALTWRTKSIEHASLPWGCN
jgi:hypothetical protein